MGPNLHSAPWQKEEEPSMYIYATNILHNMGINPADPLHFLRVLIISEYIHRGGPTLADSDIQASVNSKDLQLYLTNYGIPPVDLANESSVCAQIRDVHYWIPNVSAFRLFLHDAFPYLIKNPGIIEKLMGNPLCLYTAMYALLAFSVSYSSKELTSGTLCADQVYIPYAQMWASLGITDLDTFFRCWQSLHYYESKAEPMYVPGILKKVINAYKKQKAPHPVLLSHFVRFHSWNETLEDEADRDLLNPWIESRKADGLPTIEHGMTQDEALFNDPISKLVAAKVTSTDLVNVLFYKGRSDTQVERHILFPAMQMDIQTAARVLVVNPSPSFCVDYASSALTAGKNTTFLVTDATVAKAYSSQFAGMPYTFVTSDFFDINPYVIGGDILPTYDYMIVMARDSNLACFSKVFSQCEENCRVLCFLPQTALTSKSQDENISKIFEDNRICVDSILDLPNKLSASGRHKKVLIRGHWASELPPSFALLTTSCFTPGASSTEQKTMEKRKGKALQTLTNYTVVDRAVRLIPYHLLDKHYTVKQMCDYHDKALHPQAGISTAKMQYKTGNVFHFSQDIDITINLYEKPDGRFTVRAYRRFVSAEYGRAERNNGYHTTKGGNQKRTRTNYYETGPCSLDNIYSRINRWVLRPDIMNLIVRDIEAHYEEHPEKLTLKTVWYCNRADLKSYYLSYDDELAIQLFCHGDQHLSDLPICNITEEKIFEALQLTLPEAEDDPRYRRLLDLIFRIAVKRNFLEDHPFKPIKTSLEQDRRKAMRQLRNALGKDALSFQEIRKVLAFLLEPVDDLQTPRAVKESCWLIPLIRLCTAMPLREICALRWKDLHRIGDLDAYQFYVTRLVNDFGEPVPITNYRYIKKYRKVPCVSLLRDVLLQRLEYMEKNYGISPSAAMTQPMIYAEEPIGKRRKRKKEKAACAIRQARAVSTIAMSKADIPSEVITLLDGEAAFQEDLNACRNDLYYSNFLHHVSIVCGLSEGMTCYILGRKGPNCFSEHYVDYRNDFVQLDMIQRMDRLWAYVMTSGDPATHTYTIAEKNSSHTITVNPQSGTLASAEVTIVPQTPFSSGDIRVRVECEHGADQKITTYPGG